MKILHKTDSEFIFPYFQLVERLGMHSIGFANCIYQILSSASEAELWRPLHTRFRVSLQKILKHISLAQEKAPSLRND